MFPDTNSTSSPLAMVLSLLIFLRVIWHFCIKPRQENSNKHNNTNISISQIGLFKNIQLVGTEQIIIMVNFSSKPIGLAADYKIEGKPLILIDNKTLIFEYSIDNNDEICISDMYMAMWAIIGINDPVDDSNIIHPRVLSNPANITNNTDGSKTYSNNPKRVGHVEIDEVIVISCRKLSYVLTEREH